MDNSTIEADFGTTVPSGEMEEGKLPEDATFSERLEWLLANEHYNLPFFIINSTVGLVAFTLSALIVAVVLRFPALRSRTLYILVAGLAGADSLHVSSFLHTVWYFYLPLSGNVNSLKLSKFTCSLLPHNLVWRMQNIAQPAMLLVVSLDRLLAVAVPVSYFKWDVRTYAGGLVLAAYGSAVSYALAHLVYPFWHRSELVDDPNCWDPSYQMQTPFSFQVFEHRTRASLSLASMAIFLAVPALLTRHSKISNVKPAGGATKKATGGGGGEQARAVPDDERRYLAFKATQRRILVTVLISAGFTLVLDGVPHLMGTFFWLDGVFSARLFGMELSAYLWQVSKLNGIVNFALYAWRFTEFRLGLRAFLTRSKMPNNFTQWKAQSTVAPNDVQMT